MDPMSKEQFPDSTNSLARNIVDADLATQEEIFSLFSDEERREIDQQAYRLKQGTSGPNSAFSHVQEGIRLRQEIWLSFY